MLPTPLEIYNSELKKGAIQEDRHQKKAIEALQKLYSQLQKKSCVLSLIRNLNKRTPATKGVYLHGGVGRGKSMLMDMFFETIPDDIGKRRVHFHEFMIEVHDFMHKQRKAKKGKDAEAESVLLKFAVELGKNVRVLCFDEFHVTDIADAMILGRLFSRLFEQGLIVVATSNWSPESLYEGGLQRDLFLPFIGLLKKHSNVVEVDGPVDFRLQCLTDTGVYFSPLDGNARKAIENAFVRLSNGAKTYDEILHVKGREIKVPSVAKGIARFSFSDLCEKPLGAEDYILIASSYHTVFIEDIPELGADNRNEAKRFMNLVDALYEHKTKLVVSAETLPEKIYKEGDHNFEFMRTSSRLREMQGEEYIAAKRGV
jgi:cell division protein ZapE